MTEHLLLGILRQDETVAKRLDAGAPEAIRKELGQLAPPEPERDASPDELSHSTRRIWCWACCASKTRRSWTAVNITARDIVTELPSILRVF